MSLYKLIDAEPLAGRLGTLTQTESVQYRNSPAVLAIVASH